MDTMDGVEGVWDGGMARMRAEEVKGLEALVGSMSGGVSANGGKEKEKEEDGDGDAMDTT